MTSTTDSNTTKQSIRSRPSLVELPERLLFGIFALIMNGIGFVMEAIQSRVGVRHMAYIFVLPNLLIFGVFVLFPMLLNFYYALTGGTNLFPQDRPFVGTRNLEQLFNCGSYLDPNTCQEDLFWRSIYNTAFFVIFQVAGMVFFSLVTALILNRDIRGRGFFRSIFFYPVLLSPVVVGLIWKWILQREGVINAVVTAFGGEPFLFLLNSQWSTFWVITVSIWALMGFYTLILLAGLQSIPGSLYEAGQIDGTSSSDSFRYITMPLLMPTMFVVLVLALIRAVQVFDQVFVLTGGGPGSATTYVVQYIYATGFSNQVRQFGLASAASVVLGVSLLILTLIQLRLGRDSDAV